MTLFIGCDHAGRALVEELIPYLKEHKITFEDCGAYDEQSVDYPDYAQIVCEKLSTNPKDQGLLICGSGIGMAIAANRYKHIRAVVCNEPLSAQYSRTHNDANVLCLPARFIGITMAQYILKTWLEAKFEGGRHQKRIDKMS